MAFATRLARMVQQAEPRLEDADIDQRVFELLQDGADPEFRNWMWQNPACPTNHQELLPIVRNYDRMKTYRKTQAINDKANNARAEIRMVQDNNIAQEIQQLKAQIQELLQN